MIRPAGIVVWCYRQVEYAISVNLVQNCTFLHASFSLSYIVHRFSTAFFEFEFLEEETPSLKKMIGKNKIIVFAQH